MDETNRPELALVVGAPSDCPPPGAVRAHCSRCERLVTVGREGQRRMREQPGTLHLVVCLQCVMELSRDAVRNGLSVDVLSPQAGEAS